MVQKKAVTQKYAFIKNSTIFISKNPRNQFHYVRIKMKQFEKKKKKKTIKFEPKCMLVHDIELSILLNRYGQYMLKIYVIRLLVLENEIEVFNKVFQ